MDALRAVELMRALARADDITAQARVWLADQALGNLEGAARLLGQED